MSQPAFAHACSHCGLPALSACSACKTSFYCAQPCQRAHWGAHKPVCRAISEEWAPLDARHYGVWGPRLSLLTAERPTFATCLITRHTVCARDSSAPPQPLCACLSLSSPSLPPSVAQAVLELAGEARAAMLAAPDAAARSALQLAAFNLALLAASPECTAAAAGPEGPQGEGQGAPPMGMAGGNAEAQFHIGLAYYAGTAPGCPDGRRVEGAAVAWMLMAGEGGHAPAQQWLRQHIG
jgi:hypothetical protein